jgi:hypothetical protein
MGGAVIDGCIDLWETRDVPELVFGLVNLRSVVSLRPLSPFRLFLASEEVSVEELET